jgi:hypothetical protein
MDGSRVTNLNVAPGIALSERVSSKRPRDSVECARSSSKSITVNKIANRDHYDYTIDTIYRTSVHSPHPTYAC